MNKTERAQYEYERELDLALEMLEKKSVDIDYETKEWYEKTLSFECEILKAFKLKRILMIGTGPFPISAVSYMEKLGVEVDGVEKDRLACKISEQVALLYNRKFLVMHEDAFNLTDFSGYDCIIVGLVVGPTDEEKKMIVKHFLKHAPDDILLVFRTAWGKGKKIYPSVEIAGYNEFQDPLNGDFTILVVDRSKPLIPHSPSDAFWNYLEVHMLKGLSL